ncbi:DUF4387 domain-containing protein [Alkalicella caledoniensis]|uniref:DUF4387 domain-containing protein n=1 Tax=Alkalicella caledoniensis TaxID=2731377 RepID=A0A7G9W4R6_ALKCA|nr:DUF4387 domain-containing protein [Alkalicella caledoniensis]QNO13678.1 DUF4387 domain-containing protein [Alkalicella caledoniensis]
MKNISITELTNVIRSKNAGPYELTFDFIFKNEDIFNKIVQMDVINEELIAKLYKIPVEKVISVVAYKPAKAIKATIIRPIAAGDLGETDVYGAQQHGPLLAIEIPWEGSV